MTCTIALSALTPVMSGSQLVSISLQGTVQFSGGDHCTSLDISVSCGDVTVTQNIPLFYWMPTWAGFVAQFPNLPPGIANCCGHDVTVTVYCPACGTHTYLLPLNCAKKCPDLAAIMCDVGPCQFDGTIQLNCNAQVTALNGYPGGITLQWKQNGNPVGSPVTMTAPGWVPMVFTLPGAGQTVNLLLEIINPIDACPPIGMTVTLPACGPGCQPILIDSKIGECNTDGTRPVTITAVLTGGTATTQINATMTTPCGTTPVTGSGTGSLTLTSSCDLGPGTYTVTVTAAGCPPQSYTFTVPECCPKITISHASGNCQADDTRPVTITAVLTGVSSTAPITATMMGPCGSVTQSGTGSVTLTSSCALAAGSYTVTVTAVGCPPQTYAFTVPACCPKIVISHAVKDCNPDGTRPVIITAVLTAGSASTSINATMISPCGTTPGTGAGTLTLTDSCDLNTGSYTVTVTAAGCPAQTYTFSVQDCCPGVDFEHVVCGDPECGGQGTRPVHLIAHITPHPGVQTTAQLIDDSGTTLASNTASTPFTLTGTGSYTSGSHQVTVSFGPPLHCPDRSYQFCVPECETPDCLAVHTTIIILGTVVAVLSILSGIAVFANYLAFYVPALVPWLQNYTVLSLIVNGPYYFYPILIAASAALLIAVFLWLLCIHFLGVHIGYCCKSKCVFLTILWQITLMTSAILFFLIAACFLLILVTAILLLILAWIICWFWRKKCCVGKCDPLYYTYMAWDWMISAAYVIVLYANLIAAVNTAPWWFYVVSLLAVIIGNIIKYSLKQQLKSCLHNC